MPDALVVIRVFNSVIENSVIEADFARSILESAEIPSFVSTDDCGAMRPDFQFSTGVRLLVPREVAEDAIRLLDEAELA